MLTHPGPYGYTMTGAHRIGLKIKSLIGKDNKRLQLTAPVVLTQIGKVSWYYAETDHGPRWARFENGHVVVRKERPTC